MKKITQQDIANALNMSRISVSKALNNEPGIAEKTKQLVFQKAKEMGYQKLLRYSEQEETVDKSNMNVYLISHEGDSLNHFWGGIVRGIIHSINEIKSNIVLSFVRDDEEVSLTFPANFKPELALGIIVLGRFSRPFMEKILSMRLPTVAIGSHIGVKETNLRLDTVMVVNEDPVYEITERLIRSGSREIGFIGEIEAHKSFSERYKGYRTAMLDHGLTIDKGMCFVDKPKGAWFYTENEVREGIRRFSKMPSAIVTVNDHMAIYVMRILREMNIRVPEDVLLSGFDNIEGSTLVLPNLTTVHYPREEMGRRAAEELVWRMQNPERPFEVIRLSTRVIYRESTGSIAAEES